MKARVVWVLSALFLCRVVSWKSLCCFHNQSLLQGLLAGRNPCSPAHLWSCIGAYCNLTGGLGMLPRSRVMCAPWLNPSHRGSQIWVCKCPVQPGFRLVSEKRAVVLSSGSTGWEWRLRRSIPHTLCFFFTLGYKVNRHGRALGSSAGPAQ